MQGVDPPQLLERALVLVDAQVDEAVGEAGVAAVALDDEQGGRLLAAPVAAGSLRGVEAVEQALGERARRALEGLGDRVHGRGRDEDVALSCVAVAGPAAGPVHALAAGEARSDPVPVDDAELAVFAPVVVSGQALHDLLGTQSLT